MIHSVNVTQSPFSAIPVIAQGAHEQSGHGGSNGGWAWPLQHVLVLIKADLATVTTETTASSRDQH